MRLIILFTLLICIIIPGESIFSRSSSSSRSGSFFRSRSSGGGGSSYGWNVPRSRTSFGTRTNTNTGFSSRRSSGYGWNVPRSAKPKSSLSKNAKYALFTAGGLAAGVYLGSKLSGRSDYSFMRNDDRYNFCQGQYVDAPMGGGSQYFVCPQNPMDFMNNQCCYEGMVGYCCSNRYEGSYGTRVGGGISGAIGSLIFLAAIGACIYCLCCRKKNTDPGQVEMYAPEPNDGAGFSQPSTYPPQPPAMYPPQQPAMYPPQQPAMYPPQQPDAYPPQQPPAYPGGPQPGYPSSAPGYPSSQGLGWNQ